MAASSNVSTGQQATAEQYNLLRDDVCEFTEAWSALHANPNSGVWEDWDLASLVPAGTKYVMAVFINTKTGENGYKYGGARKNGSSDDRKWQVWHLGAGSSTICECDASRVIETKVEDKTVVECRLIGYWKSVGA